LPEVSPPPEWVAHEESSHVVIMWALGFGRKIKLATIKPRRGSWGHVNHQKMLRKGDLQDNLSVAAKDRAERAILVSLAGQFGPMRIAPDEYKPSRTNPDYELVNEIIERLYPSLCEQDMTGARYLSYMEAKAQRLVWQHRKEIEAVAKALLQGETLTGEEIIAVIYKANGLPPPGREK
jgi:ATP-dependent Zn protease